MKVYGVDASLTCTGISDGYDTWTVETFPDDVLEDRLNYVVEETIRRVSRADVVVLEGGAFSRGSQSSAAEILSGLRLMIRCRLRRLLIPVAMVAPSTLKLYTTGNGKATKVQMVAAVDERHGTRLRDFKVGDGRYDRADALALASMGYDRYGHPLPQYFPAPPPTRTSLDAVVWPELLID